MKTVITHISMKLVENEDKIKAYASVIINDSIKINALVDVIKYDINSDGEITLSDIILVQKRLISDYHFNQREIYLADFNSDNKITLSDIVLFQRYLLTR